MLYVYLDDSKNFLYRETDLKYADFVVKKYQNQHRPNLLRTCIFHI